MSVSPTKEFVATKYNTLVTARSKGDPAVGATAVTLWDGSRKSFCALIAEDRSTLVFPMAQFNLQDGVDRLAESCPIADANFVPEDESATIQVSRRLPIQALLEDMFYYKGPILSSTRVCPNGLNFDHDTELGIVTNALLFIYAFPTVKLNEYTPSKAFTFKEMKEKASVWSIARNLAEHRDSKKTRFREIYLSLYEVVHDSLMAATGPNVNGYESGVYCISAYMRNYKGTTWQASDTTLGTEKLRDMIGNIILFGTDFITISKGQNPVVNIPISRDDISKQKGITELDSYISRRMLRHVCLWQANANGINADMSETANPVATKVSEVYGFVWDSQLAYGTGYYNLSSRCPRNDWIVQFDEQDEWHWDSENWDQASRDAMRARVDTLRPIDWDADSENQPAAGNSVDLSNDEPEPEQAEPEPEPEPAPEPASEPASELDTGSSPEKSTKKKKKKKKTKAVQFEGFKEVEHATDSDEFTQDTIGLLVQAHKTAYEELCNDMDDFDGKIVSAMNCVLRQTEDLQRRRKERVEAFQETIDAKFDECCRELKRRRLEDAATLVKDTKAALWSGLMALKD